MLIFALDLMFVLNGILGTHNNLDLYFPLCLFPPSLVSCFTFTNLVIYIIILLLIFFCMWHV